MPLSAGSGPAFRTIPSIRATRPSPQIHGPGEPQPDFRLDGDGIHGLHGLVSLFGIENPGLTSSLAIGEAVAGRLLGNA